jgi:hypothetical protein
MVAVAIALVVVAVVLFLAVGLGESFWLSDVRRRRAFIRDNERPS